ncbi:MAG: hypothetical protein Q8P53_03115 [Candidatus Shapirobacteria bacterium]|nr:hypothetical protein [Candidatus Shapirobacteria bacterium]
MFLVNPAYAQCPVCIVTVGGGMFIARKLGVDDLLVSTWIAALNVAASFWLAPKIKNRILGNPVIFSLLMLGFTFFYFYTTKQIGLLHSKILGVDKIILGQIIGTLIMFLGIFIDRFSRIKNGGKILFPYQKVIFPIGSLLIITLIFKFAFNL